MKCARDGLLMEEGWRWEPCASQSVRGQRGLLSSPERTHGASSLGSQQQHSPPPPPPSSILFLTISGLKRGALAGFTVSIKLSLIKPFESLVASWSDGHFPPSACELSFSTHLRHRVKSAMGVLTSSLLHAKIRIDFVNRENLIQVVTGCCTAVWFLRMSASVRKYLAAFGVKAVYNWPC